MAAKEKNVLFHRLADFRPRHHRFAIERATFLGAGPDVRRSEIDDGGELLLLENRGNGREQVAVGIVESNHDRLLGKRPAPDTIGPQPSGGNRLVSIFGQVAHLQVEEVGRNCVPVVGVIADAIVE